MTIKKISTLLLSALLFLICSSLMNDTMPNPKAEKFYKKAVKILYNTPEDELYQNGADKVFMTIEKAIAIDSTVPEYYRIRGRCYHYKRENTNAIINFLKAINIDSTHVLTLMNLAKTYEIMDSFQLSETYYLQASDYSKDPVYIYFNLGNLYEKWDKDSLALKTFNRVIKLAPRYGDAYVNRAFILMSLNSYDEAIADLDLVIKNQPTNKTAYNNRGFCHLYFKHYQLAIADFEQSLNLPMDKGENENNSTKSYAYNNLGNCYKALGDVDAACKYWKLALQKGYVYQAKWKADYGIDDPKELIAKHCQ